MHIKSRDMSQGISLLLGFQAPVLSDWLFRPLSERSADSLKRKRVAFSLGAREQYAFWLRQPMAVACLKKAVPPDGRLIDSKIKQLFI